MKPAAFVYLRPASLEEALDQLARLGPGAKVIAGGQSLGPMMNMRLAAPAQLIDLNDLTELAYIREAGDWIEIGALTRHYQVAESALVRRFCPLLEQAAPTIGHYAIRQRGTLGGSLAHADPAAQLALVAVTLGARLKLVRAAGHRWVQAADFFQSAMTTVLAPDELVLSVQFPKAAAQEAASFRMFNRRHGDYAIVAVAATVALAGDQVAALRLGVSGVAPMPLSLRELAQTFCGRVPDEPWVAQLAAAARDSISPEDDGRISALYRRELTESLVTNALGRALAKLNH
ncbi:MAG: binding domain in molybdopterin dehydrogenase family protein [Ramlibacter sp.]|nr:binding domain in molybdopterin dehydrogenase family protein [Ramlibacter sp.]